MRVEPSTVVSPASVPGSKNILLGNHGEDGAGPASDSFITLSMLRVSSLQLSLPCLSDEQEPLALTHPSSAATCDYRYVTGRSLFLQDSLGQGASQDSIDST